VRFDRIAFDLDDTLIPNSYRYSHAIFKCSLIITDDLKHLAPYATDLVQMNLKIDSELVATHGFGIDRFPASWVKTYEACCAKADIEANPKVSARLLRCAASFRKEPFVTFPGVPQMLETLRNENRRLFLVTTGDEQLQWTKILSSDLRRRFDIIRVVGGSKKAALAEIAGSSPDRAIMVGDGLKSDVLPAVELGMTAIHVPSNTWFVVNCEVDASKYHCIASVIELPDLLHRLEG
jgi:putative hydrolase of the HAD superfamily